MLEYIGLDFFGQNLLNLRLSFYDVERFKKVTGKCSGLMVNNINGISAVLKDDPAGVAKVNHMPLLYIYGKKLARLGLGE